MARDSHSKSSSDLAAARQARGAAEPDREGKKQEIAAKAAKIEAHSYSLTELGAALDTNLQHGLVGADAARKLARDGRNQLTPPPDTPWYVKLLRQMIGGFQLMMIAGAVLCWIAGPLSDPVDFQTIYLGIVLIIVVVRCVRVCVRAHVYRIDLTIIIIIIIIMFTIVVSTGFFAFLQERKSDSVMAGAAEGSRSTPWFYLRFRLKPFGLFTHT